MKKLLYLAFIFLPYLADSQETVKDTLKPKPSVTHFLQIIDGTYSDTLTDHVWLLSNPDCHKCLEVKEKLTKAGISYIEYDVRDPEILGLAYELVRKFEKSEKIAFSYPLILVNYRLYYNFPDVDVIIKEIKPE